MPTDDDTRTDRFDAVGESHPATIVRSEAQSSSEAPVVNDEGGNLRVMTTTEASSVTIYYDVLIVERRRALFRRNRGAALGASTSD